MSPNQCGSLICKPLPGQGVVLMLRDKQSDEHVHVEKRNHDGLRVWAIHVTFPLGSRSPLSTGHRVRVQDGSLRYVARSSQQRAESL